MSLRDRGFGPTVRGGERDKTRGGEDEMLGGVQVG